jgi:hypothetical protein
MSELRILRTKKISLKAGDVSLVASNRRDIPRIVRHLAAPDAVYRLAFGGPAAPAQIVALLRALPRGAQKDILVAPEAIRALANNGQARQVMGLVKALSHAAQREIMTMPYVLGVLANNGQARQIMALIKGLPRGAQKDVLVADGALPGLILSKQTAEVMKLIETMPQGTQKDILAANGTARALAYYGQGEKMVAIVKALPEKAQREIIGDWRVLTQHENILADWCAVMKMTKVERVQRRQDFAAMRFR